MHCFKNLITSSKVLGMRMHYPKNLITWSKVLVSNTTALMMTEKNNGVGKYVQNGQNCLWIFLFVRLNPA
jgi:hypothetical protein